MRLDKLLWFLRLAKSRTAAHDLIEAGHIRVNGHRIQRAHCQMKVGDVIVLPIGEGVRVIEVTALPVRRGPFAEARLCYRALDERRPIPIAGHETTPATAPED